MNAIRKSIKLCHPNNKLTCLTIMPRRTKILPNPPFRRLSDPHEVAIEHMDKVYGQCFKDAWPSMRCGILSRNKFAALINNDTINENDIEELKESDGFDILNDIRTKARNCFTALNNEINNLKVLSQEEINYEAIDTMQAECNIYKSYANTCRGMKLFCHPRSVIKEFKPPKHGKYFLMDAASVLPIIALDPQNLDKILDYVASPATFLSLLLQTSYKSILCTHNDKVEATNIIKKLDSRNVKFEKVILSDHLEVPKNFFDKVIVNAPCTDDRISAQPCDNSNENIYSRHRKRERAQLPYTQTTILRNAIMACKPGGSVVYSTNTAQALQNEIVVNTAIQSLADEQIECEAVDLKILGDLVKDHMNVFYNDYKIGFLVTPHVEANFGPLYTCKINRIK